VIKEYTIKKEIAINEISVKSLVRSFCFLSAFIRITIYFTLYINVSKLSPNSIGINRRGYSDCGGLEIGNESILRMGMGKFIMIGYLQ